MNPFQSTTWHKIVCRGWARFCQKVSRVRVKVSSKAFSISGIVPHTGKLINSFFPKTQ